MGSHRVGHDWSNLTVAAAYNGFEAGEKYIKNKIASKKYDEISELE